MPGSWSFWCDALPPVVLCGIVVAILHVSHRQAIGSPWIYPWIYPWIFPWISTKKSVDMDVAADGKFHIHGNSGSIRTVLLGLYDFAHAWNTRTCPEKSWYGSIVFVGCIIQSLADRTARQCDRLLVSYCSSVTLCTVHCATFSEQVNRKCPIRTLLNYF